MRYLSLYGSEGFRTFRGILNGKNNYVPEKIAKINPEILLERDFSMRLQEIVAPYTDNHPKLKDILPVVTSNIGSLHKINTNYSLWRPQDHLSILSQHLLANVLEAFMPDEFKNTLYFKATHDDMGHAFSKAFSLEQKKILIPEELLGLYNIPQNDDNTTVYQYKENYTELLNENQKVSFGAKNIVRILGHVATIVHALFETEATRQRFYNDPVSLVLPADNGEYILAAYYLAQSSLPIKNIYAVSTRHRMVHSFLEKGEYKVSDLKEHEELEISFDRLLFELARGSVEKLVMWKKELVKDGSFKVDAKTLSNIQSLFKSYYATKGHTASVLEDFKADTNIEESKISLMAYKISKETKEHILAFDLEEPRPISALQELKIFTTKDF